MASWLSRSLVFSCSGFLVAAQSVPYYQPKLRRTCASPDPGDDLLAHHQYLHANEPVDNELWNSSLIQDMIPPSDQSDPRSTTSKRASTAVAPLYTIDTYFHVVSDTGNSRPGTAAYVTDQMLTDQLAYLTASYAPWGVAFALLGTTRTTNDTWAANGDDEAMKASLRRGTYSTLNVYYQSLLQTTSAQGTVPAGSVLLGFCSLPVSGILPSTPPSVYVLDGCNVLSGTLPGSYLSGYNAGGTSVHEIGHWNGLLHPFQGLSCSPDDFGDYVADTPQEGTPTAGCPVAKDTCPDSGLPEGIYTGGSDRTDDPYGPAGYAGPDPVHNFMDYSDDACYQGFTPGQGARMVNLWVALRMGL